MSGTIRLAAHAKVNLSLDILGSRADGYHAIDSVMAQLELADVIKLTPRPDQRIVINTNHPLLPCDEGNLAYRAAAVLAAHLPRPPGVDIFIDKRIPVAAGLGGGSADAAAVFVGLNRLWALGLSRQELAARGGEIGSDVPFCVYGGCARVRGRGERVERLPYRLQGWMVLARPPDSGLASGEIYRRYDEMTGEQSQIPHTPAVVSALVSGDWRRIASCMGNHLQPAVIAAQPAVAHIQRIVREANSWGVCVSGSGPTVIVAVRDAREGQKVIRQLVASAQAQALLTRFKQ